MSMDIRRPILTIIGAGGIGSQTVDLLVPALRRIEAQCEIIVMDGDIVEEKNLGHQKYSSGDIGKTKVECLAAKYSSSNDYGVSVSGIPENFRNIEQVKDSDYVIICVDRPEPRRLVHSLEIPWIDLRCGGDGYLVLSSDSQRELVAHMTPDHEPKSCQHEGALNIGNLEFGFAISASYGAQWALQQLRKSPSPIQAMGSMNFGQLSFPDIRGKKEAIQ
ncbi:MAG: ThiF family adenylyltransferase [Candidatus Poseidoniaceae archaeon]|nr:ThiF family adenylyltransferase [Candidatus Poseidoniaceae archaeon]